MKRFLFCRVTKGARNRSQIVTLIGTFYLSRTIQLLIFTYCDTQARDMTDRESPTTVLSADSFHAVTEVEKVESQVNEGDAVSSENKP